MRRFFGGVNVMLLGAALAVGCGGSMQEDKTEAEAPGAVTGTAPADPNQTSKPGIEDDSSQGEGQPGTVGESSILLQRQVLGDLARPLPLGQVRCLP